MALRNGAFQFHFITCCGNLITSYGHLGRSKSYMVRYFTPLSCQVTPLPAAEPERLLPDSYMY